MINPEDIHLNPEAVRAGEIYREAVECAKLYDFPKAIQLAESLREIQFKLHIIFKDEALLAIIHFCLEANQVELARDLARKIESRLHRGRAIEITR
jgi:hypothetical protein